MIRFILLLCLLITSIPSVYAQEDEIDLEGARVFGNRDLPNITYIVPWKDEELEVLDIQPVTNFFDNALKPLDRDAFLREIEHLERLRKEQ